MCESNFKVMSRRRCRKSSDLGASILFPDWWYRLMRLWSVKQEQMNDPATRVSLVPEANLPKALFRSF